MEKQRAAILEKVRFLSAVTPADGETFEQTLLRGLEQMEKRCSSFSQHEEELENRTKEILNVLVHYAQLNYNAKATVEEKGSLIDGLAAGVNMMGEELKSSTISSHEKDILLKEIHHRVKNNLQIISSLLNLQSDQIKDEFAREKYKVSRDRIQSMALVHEKLYESENFERIDFAEYVDSLTRSLNNSYNPDMKRIAINVDMQLSNADRLFRIETAIPCGLILNELLSNCFKYAFPGNKKGRIDVLLNVSKKSGKTFHHIMVSDNGIGLPENMNVQTTESLGMQLVHMLADQLNAELKIENKNGVTFSFDFEGC